ncbi:MAG: alkaline phosphatase family protein, partial [Caldilineaceae bacterium]|nr:alkaline phosphatase family protein [Caldilineaceae bacterium]
MFNRYGFTDQTTAALLKQLIEEGNMPDFTLAYFPGNDFRSHEVGPEAALDQIEALDEELGQIFATYGGLDKFLSDVTIVLTGDHSQSDVVSGTEKAGIRLDELLESFAVAEAGTPMEDEDDLVVCPNLRTAQIYFHSPSEARFRKVVDCLLPDARVDQVLWSAGLLNPDQRGYHVMTAERGHLHFWPGAEGPQSAQDRFGNLWSWEGDLRAVDGTVETGDVDRITFDDYPNAFERIACALNAANGGHMWATAVPGTEFQLESSLVHVGGGSHGSLHRVDSTMPLIVAGAPRRFHLPEATRTVDVLPICLSILGVQSEYSVGASHVQAQQ